MILHAGLIARRLGSGWRGALIQGHSGSGKSDLMLRAVDQGWRLVGDDRVIVWASGGRAWGRAPARLHGLIEARGVGIGRTVPLHLAPIDLVADDTPAETVERLPDPDTVAIAGVEVRRLCLRLLDTSAPAKLACALGWDWTPL